jgi:hypothetical protein
MLQPIQKNLWRHKHHLSPQPGPCQRWEVRGAFVTRIGPDFESLAVDTNQVALICRVCIWYICAEQIGIITASLRLTHTHTRFFSCGIGQNHVLIEEVNYVPREAAISEGLVETFQDGLQQNVARCSKYILYHFLILWCYQTHCLLILGLILETLWFVNAVNAPF